MKKLMSMVVILVLAFAIEALAAGPLVSMSITAQKSVVETQNGQKIKKMVEATTIEPGDVVFYSINFINSGDDVATKVYFEDPIPTGTVYVAGSAWGTKDSKIFVSVDGGKTFKEEAKKDDVTHVRWVIDKIDAGGKGKVGFEVKVK